MRYKLENIGGAFVRRGFRMGNTFMMPGVKMSADQVINVPEANRNALVDAGFIELWPKAGDRFVVPRGGGKFDVIEGRIVNSQPLTKKEAEDLAFETDIKKAEDAA